MNIPITIVGAYGKGNLGDDILMNAVLASIRGVVPDSDVCVQTGPSVDYPLQWHPGIRFLSVNSADPIATELLIYGGGTQFCAYAKTRGWGDRIGRASRYLLRPSVLWQRCRTRTVKTIEFRRAAAISLGVGPFVPGSSIEKRAQTYLRRLDWLSVRDSLSQEYCTNFGVKHTRLNADICSASEFWGAGKVEPSSQRGHLERIGVIVRDWPYDREGGRYLHPLRKAIEQVRATGIHAEYISFAPHQDKSVVSQLRASGEEVLCWDPIRGSVADFVSLLGTFDLLVSSRAHGIIIGAALGIPSIAIEVESKLRVIAASLNGGSELWPRPFDKEQLLRQVSVIVENWRGRCATVSSEAARCASEAKQSAAELRGFVREAIRSTQSCAI